MCSEPVIEIDNLGFAYGPTRIFSGDSACIHRDDYVAVVGPNGGGKSTLIKLITGLLKPAEGSILIKGNPPSAANSVMGYVPQYVNFDALFPITVTECVMTGTLQKGWGFYSRKNRETAQEMIATVGLEAEKDNSFAAISGGQRRRALIARALASRPEILVLDEPTAGVDARAEKEFHQLLVRLSRNLTIILITHDFSFVDAEVSRVFCVNRHIEEHPAELVNEEYITARYGRRKKTVLHQHHLEHAHTDTPHAAHFHEESDHD